MPRKADRLKLAIGQLAFKKFYEGATIEGADDGYIIIQEFDGTSILLKTHGKPAIGPRYFIVKVSEQY